MINLGKTMVESNFICSLLWMECDGGTTTCTARQTQGVIVEHGRV